MHAKPEMASQDRIAPGEQHTSAGVLRVAAEVAHEGGENLVDIEGGRIRLRRRSGRPTQTRGHRRAGSRPTGRLKEFPPGRFDHTTPQSV